MTVFYFCQCQMESWPFYLKLILFSICFRVDLVGRLERLICREKSDMRMWEYEMSKRTENKSGHRLEPAVFRVQKMWKEFSRLILQCTLVKQDPPGKWASMFSFFFLKKLLSFASIIFLVFQISCTKSTKLNSLVLT